MKPGNDSRAPGFLLLGFSEAPELQPLLFGLFLSMYLLTFWGNLLLILAVGSDPRLHTPMYFFLSNLSLVDICATSTTVPKMLRDIWTRDIAIGYTGCLSQMYCVLLFSVLEILLLTAMAYDRYVAICHPLHYPVIMSPRLCRRLVLSSWALSSSHALLHSLLALRLAFCGAAAVPQFFCELKQLVELACSDTGPNRAAIYAAAGLLGCGTFVGILWSYYKIAASILGISSPKGRHKAFSTCVSHLSVVSLFYCTILGVYLDSAGAHSPRSGSAASVMYTVVAPMLNPFIYSLRNQDIKRALTHILGKRAI